MVLLVHPLPDLDACSLVRRLTSEPPAPMVLVLSTSPDLECRLRYLAAGAVDYLLQPCALAEMRARILTYLLRPGSASPLRERRRGDRRRNDRRKGDRRSGGAPAPANGASSPAYEPVLSLDPARHCAMVGGQTIPLSTREFSLLSMLSAAPDGSCTAEEILRDLWRDSESNSNVIQVTVGRLRKKVGPDCIKTLRGSGYRLGMRINYVAYGE